jgi:hypothetical protein
MLDKILHTTYIKQKSIKDLLFELFKFVNDNNEKIDIMSIDIEDEDHNWHANIYYEIV